jgi:hypothetical protein
METVVIDGWEFLCDPELTRESLARAGLPSPEQCECAECRNFVLARTRIYDGQPGHLLAQFGISPPWEAHVYHIGELTEDGHRYEGWTHFVGRIVTATPTEAGMVRMTPPSDPWAFDVYFHDKPRIVPDSFEGHSVVELAFLVFVPWLLDEPIPEYLR